MSTPSRTPHRLCIPTNIDTRRAPEDYSAASGWDTPLSADRRRPSLTYSALSEPSPASLPTTPGYRLSAHDIAPLYFDSNNALRMMTQQHVKPSPGMIRMVRDANAAPFGLVTPEEPNFHVPTTMSPVNESFNTSFSSGVGHPWEPLTEASAHHLGAPFGFKPQATPGGSFSDPVYSDHHAVVTQCPVSGLTTMVETQHYGQPLLVAPSDVHGYMPDYSQPMDSGMATPIDHSTLASSSLDSLSSFGSWQADPESPVHDYSLSGDVSMSVKEESPMQMLTMAHPAFESPTTPRRDRLRSRGSTQRRGRTDSMQYVTSLYNVDLAIDPKGVEFNALAGRFQKKNVNTETKRWKCSWEGCESRSARKEHLRRHELSHQKDKQFHCALPKCGRAITRSDNLIQHLMTHARPLKPGKRNNHHSRERIERMVMETMTDKKLVERTITNLGKAIEREQEKWNGTGIDVDWAAHEKEDDDAANDSPISARRSSGAWMSRL